jgi:osmotically-inducible protein OsmY
MRDDRDWQSQQRQGSGRTSASQRFGESYNPEPQWLREDRDYAASSGNYARDEEDFGSDYRSTSEYGRGSYASSGRPWGEQQARDYERDQGEFQGYGASRQYGSQQYGSQQGSRQQQYERYGASQGGYGGSSFGAQNQQRGLGGRSTQSGYGASRGQQEYTTPGYETAGYENELGYAGQSMSGRGYGSQYRAGTSSGYGSSSGYQLGTQQTDTGYQRSYRGMGPQSYTRPDDRIRDDVYEKLTDSDEIDARSIMVDVNQGNVTLTGTVPERRMRYAAEDLVEGCMGVANINNQLKVQGRESESTTGSSLSGSSMSGSSSMGSSSTSGLGASGTTATGTTTGTGTAGGTGSSSSSTSTESKRH